MKDILHIYKRVSSQVQTEGTSLKTQEDIGIKLAQQLGMNYQIHNEGGKSSASDDLLNRPVMSNLLRLMDKGVVKHLYVYNTDRLSRNQITWYTIRQKMVSNLVTLYTPKGIHKTEDSMENMILGILSEISQYDNKVRSERSRLGKLEKVKLNYWRGGDCPFGYKLESDGFGNKLVENFTESRWVKRIFQEYASGTKMKDIKLLLEENNVQTRRENSKWSLGSLQLMIRNKTYTGIDVFFDKKTKETVTNNIPAIISNKLFAEANIHRNELLVRKGQMNRTTKFYLFRDFFVCSCGTPMSGRMKNGEKQQLYYCPMPERRFNSNKLNGVECDMKRSLNIPSADQELWTIITTFLSDSIAIRKKFQDAGILGKGLNSSQIRKYIEKKRLDIQNDLIEKVKVEKALVQVESTYALGDYSSVTVYQGVKRDLEAKLKQVSIRIESLLAELEHLNDKDSWLEWVDELAVVINSSDKLSPIQKRKFLKLILRRIDVSHDTVTNLHRLRINFRLPLMTDLGGILKHNPVNKTDNQNKVKYFQSVKTPVFTGAPDISRTLHSTVTDFARFLGWSTLQPRMMAMW